MKARIPGMPGGGQANMMRKIQEMQAQLEQKQAEIEARIVQLEKMLRNAEVIDEEGGAKDTIGLGATVTVLDVEFDEEMEYTIVGSAEADPMNGRISNESPVGMALIGHKEGDSVSIDTPDGEAIFKVLKIKK
jgi:transcription elongation factor GreA